MYAYFDSVHFYRLIMEKARESIKATAQNELQIKSHTEDESKIKVKNGVSNHNVEYQITFFFEQLICNIESKSIQFEDIQHSCIHLSDFKALFHHYTSDELKECIQIINGDKYDSLDVSFSFSQFKSFCMKLERNVLCELLSCIYYPDITSEVMSHIYKSKNYETYKSNEYRVVQCDY